MFEYNAKPVLAGRLHKTSTGSSLDLRYRAPVWVYGFYLVGYLSLTLIAVGLLSNDWAPEVSGGDKAMAFAIFAALLGAPLGLHLIGTMRSDEELTELIDFLAEHAEAKR